MISNRQMESRSGEQALVCYDIWCDTVRNWAEVCGVRGSADEKKVCVYYRGVNTPMCMYAPKNAGGVDTRKWMSVTASGITALANECRRSRQRAEEDLFDRAAAIGGRGGK